MSRRKIMVMVDYIKKNLYDQALIHFALIGDKSSKGDTNIIAHSVKDYYWLYAHVLTHNINIIHQNCDRILP